MPLRRQGMPPEQECCSHPEAAEPPALPLPNGTAGKDQRNQRQPDIGRRSFKQKNERPEQPENMDRTFPFRQHRECIAQAVPMFTDML